MHACPFHTGYIRLLPEWWWWMWLPRQVMQYIPNQFIQVLGIIYLVHLHANAGVRLGGCTSWLWLFPQPDLVVEAPEPDNRVQEVWKGFSQGSCTKLYEVDNQDFRSSSSIHCKTSDKSAWTRGSSQYSYIVTVAWPFVASLSADILHPLTSTRV